MYALEVLQNVAAPGRPSGPKPPSKAETPRSRFDEILQHASRSRTETRPAQSRTAPATSNSPTQPQRADGKAPKATVSSAPSTQERPQVEQQEQTEGTLASAGAQAVLMALLLGQTIDQAPTGLPVEPSLLGAGGAGGAPVNVVDAVLTHVTALAALAEGEGEQAALVAAPTSTQLEAFVAQAASIVTDKPVQPLAAEAQRTHVPDATDATGEANGADQPTFRQLVDMVVRSGGSDGQESALTDQNGKGEMTAPAVKEQAPSAHVAPPVVSFQEVAALGEAVQEEVPLRPVEPEPVIRQVAQFARVILRDGRSEAKLQLHPEHLGQIHVKLVVADGVVKANLHVTDQAVKAALEANLEQFKARMADQGLQVEQVQVSVGAGNQFQGQGRGDQFSSQSRHAGRDGHPQSDGSAAEERQELAQPEQGRFRSVGGRLNSLA